MNKRIKNDYYFSLKSISPPIYLHSTFLFSLYSKSSSSILSLKFLNEIKMQVTLSPESLTRLYLIIESTILADNACILGNLFPFFLKHQIVFKISLFSNLSKIPSPIK